MCVLTYFNKCTYFIVAVVVECNEFQGTIPSHFGQLKQLCQLYLDNNHLEGVFVSVFCSSTVDLGLLFFFFFFFLFHLGVDQCCEFGQSICVHMPCGALLGKIPSELGHLKPLFVLSLQKNAFTGVFRSSSAFF